LYEEKSGSAVAFAPLKFRSLSEANCELVGMDTPQHMKKKEFEIFSEPLKNIILHSHEQNEQTFLFCGRKGLFPTTVCSDCGTVVVCQNCAAPVVLYGNRNDPSHNTFVCHQCGTRRDADTHCAYCNGWRLTPLGIGIDNVVKKIREMSPTRDVFIMDKDHISTHARAVALRNQFYDTPGALMVGTEMALPYLTEKIENTAVVSLDSFFAIPDFRIHEKIFHILLDMRALTEKTMLVQTRQKNTKIFDYALKGNLIDFYRDEIEERKQVNFPPFTTAIKISMQGDKKVVGEKMKEIVALVAPREISVFEGFVPGKAQEYTLHGVILLPKGQWVDAKLLDVLRSLPPSITVKIDPDTLL
jgi:primosomal protein N' (replication factor Y)